MVSRNSNRALRKHMIVAAALVAAPGVASAEMVGGVAEETGVRIGSGRLTPVFEFESIYDSAAGLDDAGEMKGDTILHIRPGIRFLAPSESVQLKLNANYDYNAYLSEELSDYSKSSADVDFGLLFNRDGNVRFEITDRFVRSDRNNAYSVDFNSIVNRNDATLRLTAISGDQWSITPKYTLTSETYESAYGDMKAVDDALSFYDNLSHRFSVEGRYSLAAKTALLLDVGVGYRGYTGDETALARVNRERAQDVGDVRAQVGVTGMVAPRVGVTVKAGYGTQFGLDDAQDGTARGFGGVLGTAEIGYYISELSSVRLGYARTFTADPTYDYYSDDRFYLESALAFTRQFGLRAGLSYDSVGFGTADQGELVDEGRTDSIFAFYVGPEYRFTQWFSAGVHYAFTKRTAELDGEEMDNQFFNYDRNELGARVTFSY